MSNNRPQEPQTKVILSDQELRKTYTHFACGSEFKTNLLGLEKGCDRTYKLTRVLGSIPGPCGFSLADIRQRNQSNCAFLSRLRTILRRYPHLIPHIIKDVGDRVEVTLFNKDGPKENPHYQPVTYLIEKTIVESSSLLISINNFFSKASGEMPWVKLIEKALVLHFMRTQYHYNLFNIQLHGHDIMRNNKGVIPSYEDVVQVNSEEIYPALLGCDQRREYFGLMNKSRDVIKDEFLKGELVVISFYDNKFGFKKDHAYELVNYGMSENEEYVILSNPWGLNHKKSNFDSKPLNLSSLKLLAPGNIEEIRRDKGIIIIPATEFLNIVEMCNISCGAARHTQLIEPARLSI